MLSFDHDPRPTRHDCVVSPCSTLENGRAHAHVRGRAQGSSEFVCVWRVRVCGACVRVTRACVWCVRVCGACVSRARACVFLEGALVGPRIHTIIRAHIIYYIIINIDKTRNSKQQAPCKPDIFSNMNFVASRRLSFAMTFCSPSAPSCEESKPGDRQDLYDAVGTCQGGK